MNIEETDELTIAFYHETDIWPPGRDMPPRMAPAQSEYHIRSRAYAYWLKVRERKAIMEKQIIDQIKKLIAETNSDETMNELRKTSYVKGYKAAMADVKKLIDFAESLAT
jgi:hypothetical protein